LLGWSDSMLICIVIMLYGVSSQIMMHHVLGLEY
jgi:hypothetical protein